jgi:hypothetical protein
MPDVPNHELPTQTKQKEKNGNDRIDLSSFILNNYYFFLKKSRTKN